MRDYLCIASALIAVMTLYTTARAQTITECEQATPLRMGIDLIGEPDGIATSDDQIVLRVRGPDPSRRLAKLIVLVDSEPALTIGPDQLENIGYGDSMTIPIDLEIDGKNPLKLRLTSDSRPTVTVFAYDEAPSGAASNCGYLSVGLRTGKITSYAVIMGFNYTHQPWRLRWAQNDAAGMVQHMLTKRQVPPENIWLLTDDPAATRLFPTISVKVAPKIGEIRKTLLSIRDEADPASTLFFYFSGHQFAPAANSYGYRFPSYLLLTESDTDDENSMYAQSTLYLLLSTQRAKAISILDACYSGALDASLKNGAVASVKSAKLLGGLLSMRDLGAVELGRASRLASSGKQGASWEFDGPNHGIFTHFLLEAGAAADKDIALHEAFDYADRMTKGYSPYPPLAGFEQDPDATFNADSKNEIWAYRSVTP